MPVSPEATRQALAWLRVTPRSGQLIARASRAEFGGEDSLLLKVRRGGNDYSRFDGIKDGDFGMYLGRHDGSYIVALQSIFPGELIGYEQYDSLDELRRNWELD